MQGLKTLILALVHARLHAYAIPWTCCGDDWAVEVWTSTRAVRTEPNRPLPKKRYWRVLWHLQSVPKITQIYAQSAIDHSVISDPTRSRLICVLPVIDPHVNLSHIGNMWTIQSNVNQRSKNPFLNRTKLWQLAPAMRRATLYQHLSATRRSITSSRYL